MIHEKNLGIHERLKDIISDLRETLQDEKELIEGMKIKKYKIHHTVIELLDNAAIVSNEALNGLMAELEKEDND